MVSRSTKIERIVSLDYLRGIAALSILFYHYGRGYDSTNLLNKLGLYGVSMFFVLSGLSMAIVYHKKVNNLKSATRFFVKRIFRIFPLHILICCLFITYNLINGIELSLYQVFINFTGLFGFIDPSNYIAKGAWSIGNELVYYAFTPIILYIYDRWRKIGNTLFLFTIGLGIFFAFYKINSSLPLNDQWSTYVNPFNNMFLYVSGIFMYYNLNNIKIRKWIAIVILVIAVGVLIALPFNSRIFLVTNYIRFLYCFIVYIIVFAFYKIKFQKRTFIGKIFDAFGMATYGIYLFH